MTVTSTRRFRWTGAVLAPLIAVAVGSAGPANAAVDGGAARSGGPATVPVDGGPADVPVDGGSPDAVANGEQVPNGTYRFAVKLTMTGIPTADGGRRNSACSGALVAQQWIITAGHCFRDLNGVRVERPVADLTTATVGRADLTTTAGKVRTVVAVRQSPTTDVALARLDAPITNIPPLALSRQAPAVGDVVRLAGYGATTGVNPAPSDRLHTGQFTITSVAETTVGVTGRKPARDTSACAYDSGAPYFRKVGGLNTLVSVESTGPVCPHALEETTSRIDTIAGWIQGIIAG